jgi:DMSO reductase anchor subunit
MFHYQDLIYIIHFLIIGPLLVYVGYYKEKVDKKIMDLVLWLGAIVIIYHLYKFINIMLAKSKYKTI